MHLNYYINNIILDIKDNNNELRYEPSKEI